MIYKYWPCTFYLICTQLIKSAILLKFIPLLFLSFSLHYAFFSLLSQKPKQIILNTLWKSSGTFRTQTLSRNIKTSFSSNLKSTPLPWLTNTNQSISSKSALWPSLISSKMLLVNFNIPKFTSLAVNTLTKLRSRNCWINSNSFTINADICNDFLLKASTTTFAFPRW